LTRYWMIPKAFQARSEDLWCLKAPVGIFLPEEGWEKQKSL